MFERKTKRYCLVCSYVVAHDYRRNSVLALEGLPSPEAVRGKPLTNLLCADHSQLFDIRQKYLQTCDDRGDPETYSNGVPFEVFIGFERRVKHCTAGIYSQDDALNLLQYLERRLRVLQIETATGMRLWHHPGDTGEERLTAAEVVERAEWARWIDDYIPKWLSTERNRTPPDDSGSSNDLHRIDAFYDDDDRISGEESA